MQFLQLIGNYGDLLKFYIFIIFIYTEMPKYIKNRIKIHKGCAVINIIFTENQGTRFGHNFTLIV